MMEPFGHVQGEGTARPASSGDISARVTSGTSDPRAVLTIEEDGLARSGRRATRKPRHPHFGAGEDCWPVNRP